MLSVREENYSLDFKIISWYFENVGSVNICEQQEEINTEFISEQIKFG